MGIPEDRFTRLWSCFVLPTHSDSASDDEEEEDEWDCIRKYIDDWNTNSADMMHCGWLLCLDELMSRWLSRTVGSLLLHPMIT